MTTPTTDARPTDTIQDESGQSVRLQDDDLDFAAHAREDLPAALAEIERRATHAATWKALARRLMRRYRSERRGHDLTRSDRKKHRAEIDRLTAELAARASADASLEARAKNAARVYDSCGNDATDSSDEQAWLAVVRAVDASRPAAPEVDDDEPLTRGTRVRTVAHLTALFSPSLHPHRRPNALGKIVRRMTSGDIYYDVRHDDGTVAGYERSELIDLTADASRPGLTEEQAREIAEDVATSFNARWSIGLGQGPLKDMADRIEAGVLRASRGETGPTWGQLALEEYRRATEPDRPAGLASIMHDAQQRRGAPPASPFGEWPDEPRGGLTCPGCYDATGIAQPHDPRATLRAGDPASPFAPGSLAAGSATEDRILDRKRGGK